MPALWSVRKLPFTLCSGSKITAQVKWWCDVDVPMSPFRCQTVASVLMVFYFYWIGGLCLFFKSLF